MRNRYSWSLLILAGFAALASAGCGSSSTPTGPYEPTPTPATTPTPVITPTPTPTPGTTPTPTPTPTATPTPTTVTVTISSFTFSPVTITAGSSVRWTNLDSMTHTATADSSSAFQFNTGNIAPGSTSAPIVFNTPGSFPYHCTPHPFMQATVVVQ